MERRVTEARGRLSAGTTKAMRRQTRSEVAGVGTSGPGKSGSCGAQRQEQRRMKRDFVCSSCGPIAVIPAEGDQGGGHLPGPAPVASSFPEQISALLTWKKPLVSPQIVTRRRDGEMFHQGETLKNVCMAELKRNSSGCPTLGVFGLRKSHHRAQAPFANPLLGAVGLAPSHKMPGSMSCPIHLREGVIFPCGRANPCLLPGDFSDEAFPPSSRAGFCPASVSGRGWRLSPWDLSAQESLEQLPAG